MISYSELFKLLRKTISQHLFKVKSTLEKIGVQLWDLFMTVNTATKPFTTRCKSLVTLKEQECQIRFSQKTSKRATTDLKNKSLDQPWLEWLEEESMEREREREKWLIAHKQDELWRVQGHTICSDSSKFCKTNWTVFHNENRFKKWL